MYSMYLFTAQQHYNKNILYFKNIIYWSHVVNWSFKYGGVVSWFTFFNVFYNFLNTSTMPSTLTLVPTCSLIYLLWNKKSPRSLECIIRKLQYKIYRYVPGGGGGWGGGGWGAHRVTHKIVKKCVTLMLHNSKSIHARAAKLHTNKD